MTLTVYGARLIGSVATRNIEKTSAEIAQKVDALSSGKNLNLESGQAGTRAIAARISSTNAALATLETSVGIADRVVELVDATASTIQDMIIRMRALAVSAASDALNDFERSLIDAEYQALLSEVDRVANDTELNGLKVTATGTPVTFENSFDAGISAEEVLREQAIAVAGAIQLTDAINNGRGAYIRDVAFDSGGGWETTFTYSTGGGSGGLGLTMFFADAANFDGASALGVVGGGYLYRNMPNAVFAVALDENGRFPSNIGFTDGGGVVPDSVAVRLGADAPTPYELLGSTDVTALGGIEGTRTVRLSMSSAFGLTVEVDFGGGFESVLSGQIDAALMPEQLKFGFTATNQAPTNVHEILEVEHVVGSAAKSLIEANEGSVKVGDGILSNDEISIPLANLTTEAVFIEGTDVLTADNAARAIRRLDIGLDYVTETRAVAGAYGSVAGFAGANLSRSLESYEEAETRLVATDVAAEITRLAMHQITLTGGISVLADAVESIEQQFATIQPTS